MSGFFENLPSEFQLRFPQDFNAQQCLTVLIEKLRKIRYLRAVLVTFLIDLWKALDCISHDLLIVMLVAFGFDRKTITFIPGYLKKRKQRAKVGSVFTDFFNMHYGVPQGSILGLFQHVIFITDLFYINVNFDYANYIDDTTLDVWRCSFAKAIDFLEFNI